jgi:hypothetical protein
LPSRAGGFSDVFVVHGVQLWPDGARALPIQGDINHPPAILFRSLVAVWGVGLARPPFPYHISFPEWQLTQLCLFCRADCIVNSFCQCRRGHDVRGEPFQGIYRFHYFIYAGCGYVYSPPISLLVTKQRLSCLALVYRDILPRTIASIDVIFIYFKITFSY